MTAAVHNIESDFAVMGPGFDATPVAVTPTLYRELDERFDGFRDHLLISCHHFEADWPSWEIHPHGDEIVMLLGGHAELVLREDQQAERIVMLHRPGDYGVVPRSTWHTAKIENAARMLFVSPGEDTRNREI